MARPPAWLPDKALAALAAVLLAALPGAALAQASEQAVKAAFLPKFMRYVDWPGQAMPAAGEPLQVCLLGRDPFGRLIDEAASGEQVAERRVVVRRIAGAEGAAGCQVAFISGGSARANEQILTALAGRPVLTVTDAREGPARGMVHFALQDGRVRFHIDEAAAARSQLGISSRLLGLALSVRGRRS